MYSISAILFGCAVYRIEIYEFGFQIVTAILLVTTGKRGVWIPIHCNALLDDLDAAAVALWAQLRFWDARARLCFRLQRINELFDKR